MLEIKYRYMAKIIKIIKFIASLKKNPYLYFSALLVSSGTILLSKSVLEILLNSSISIFSNKESRGALESIYTNTIGTVLIILGILLFYWKFLRKKDMSVEYKNDTSVIRYLFSNITTLNKLDYFIDEALYPYLLESSLYEHEHMEGYLMSANYHVYDNKLRELIQSFYEDWTNVCSHSGAFTPTNVPDRLRPNTWFDIARTEDVRSAIEEVPKFATDMHRSLKNLVSYIKTNYIGIL